jgi:hypothetical protein
MLVLDRHAGAFEYSCNSSEILDRGAIRVSKLFAGKKLAFVEWRILPIFETKEGWSGSLGTNKERKADCQGRVNGSYELGVLWVWASTVLKSRR